MVEVLRRDVTTNTNQVQECFRGDRAAMELNREEGQVALKDLERSNMELKQLLAESAANSSKLAEDIYEAITALQFQDAVNQQLEHMQATLHEVRNALGRSAQAPTQEVAKWLDRLCSRYTMRSERELLEQMTDPNKTNESPELQAIELFYAKEHGHVQNRDNCR